MQTEAGRTVVSVRPASVIRLPSHYRRQCANALFASAIRCVASFFLTALPSPFAAASTG